MPEMSRCRFENSSAVPFGIDETENSGSVTPIVMLMKLIVRRVDVSDWMRNGLSMSTVQFTTGDSRLSVREIKQPMLP